MIHPSEFTGQTTSLFLYSLLATRYSLLPVLFNQSGSLDVSYALEGSMFTSGACIQWLRDGLKLIETAAQTETIATQVNENGGVYFVPALSGLGAPHWDMSARGSFLGITAGVTREHVVRAVIEAIAYQVKEVVEAINAFSNTSIE